MHALLTCFDNVLKFTNVDFATFVWDDRQP